MQGVPSNQQSLFNHLNRPWIDLSRPTMTSNDIQCAKNSKYKKDKTRLGGGQRGDKGGWSSRTFDLLYYMIIDLDRSKDLRWLLMSGAIFILRWSCFRTRFNDRAISIFLVEEVMKSDECCRWWSGTGSMKFLHRFVNIDTWIYLSFYKYLSKLMFVWCDDVCTVIDDEVELGVWSFPTLAIKSLVHFHPPSPSDDSYLSLKRPQKVWLRHSNLVIHSPPK